MVADQVFMLHGAWKVVFGGKVCSPDFNSKGAAVAYLDQLKSGARKPEYSEEPKKK